MIRAGGRVRIPIAGSLSHHRVMWQYARAAVATEFGISPDGKLRYVTTKAMYPSFGRKFIFSMTYTFSTYGEHFSVQLPKACRQKHVM